MLKSIFGFIFLFSGFAHAARTPEQVALQKAIDSIPAFSVVDTAKVYRGGRPQPQDIRSLKEAGIKTIIDLQGGDYDLLGPVVAAAEPGELYDVIMQERETSKNLLIGWYPARLSSFTVTTEEQAHIKYALEIMSDPKMQPVFVHCEFGRDRTGLVAALYQVFYMHDTVANAYARWIASGHKRASDHSATFELDDYFFKVTSLQKQN